MEEREFVVHYRRPEDLYFVSHVYLYATSLTHALEVASKQLGDRVELVSSHECPPWVIDPFGPESLEKASVLFVKPSI